MEEFQIIDIWGIIFTYLSAKEFIQMRLNRWLNNLICNGELGMIHIIKPDTDHIAKCMSHIKSLGFQATNCRYVSHCTCDCDALDLPKDRITHYNIAHHTGGKTYDITEYYNLHTLKINGIWAKSEGIILWPKNKSFNLRHITSLDLWKCVLEDKLQYFTSLTSLKVGEECGNVGMYISRLTNLVSLRIALFNGIGDESIYSLTNLLKLGILGNNRITNNGIKGLTNLMYLSLIENEKITNDGIMYMTKLVDIDLNFNKMITDDGVSHLTSIRCVRLVENMVISDMAIQKLTNITALDIGPQNLITNNVLLGLPLLKFVGLDKYNMQIDRDYLRSANVRIVNCLDNILNV